ncbi:M23 family metallopeptidase [Asticcacaulis sp. AC466]|uniref:M23 family metallopeptidase n=1 Tax=Asticcacaulis sp. AC466 TaxID=1282362 RepID=UPI0004168226|nr:M23 family metallopeptidase [Asticcacaulis sp. AC466]
MEKLTPPLRQGLNRRSLLRLGVAALGASFPGILNAATPQPALPFGLRGKFQQSGYCIGRGAPNAELWVDGFMRGRTSETGWFYVGFDRDSVPTCSLEIRTPTRTDLTRFAIAPTTYDLQHVDGLPPETVTPTDPANLERIKRDTALKNVAFASRDGSDYFKGGFIYPLKKFQVSGHFGNQRVLNGVPKSPHYGFDMAAPVGTPVYAPQAGLVVLAEPDLFYEGGLTLIDHGQGVISMYLHQSELLVKKGDHVRQTQIIGRVGAKGRATGPHLCWRLKWGDRRMDPSLMVG